MVDPMRSARGLYSPIINIIAVAAAVFLFAGGCGGSADNASVATVTTDGDTTGAGGGSYSFAVMGDSHTDGLDNGILQRAVDVAAARGADFVIHTGDVSNIGAEEELKRYRDFIDAAPLTVFSLPGNHDRVTAGDTTLFAEIVGAPSSGFTREGDRFLLVDFSDEHMGITPEQLSWVETELEAARGARHLFVFTHIPLVDADKVPTDLLGSEAHASGRQLIELTGRRDVDAYFAGHVHGFFKYRIGEVDAWVSGGAGAETYPVEAIGFHHLLLVTVDAAGAEIEIVRL